VTVVPRYRPTRVVFDDSVSSRCTVVDIFTYDRIGLLYDITSTLTSLGIDIVLSKISTKADQVADVFLHRRSGRGKIPSPDRQEEIRRALLASVGHSTGGALVKVGILSDSHDNRGAAEGALLLFRAEGVGMVLHLGDVCSPAVLAAYGDPAIPLRGVFGNNDSDRDGLQDATGGAFRQGRTSKRWTAGRSSSPIPTTNCRGNSPGRGGSTSFSSATRTGRSRCGWERRWW